MQHVRAIQRCSTSTYTPPLSAFPAFRLLPSPLSGLCWRAIECRKIKVDAAAFLPAQFECMHAMNTQWEKLQSPTSVSSYTNELINSIIFTITWWKKNNKIVTKTHTITALISCSALQCINFNPICKFFSSVQPLQPAENASRHLNWTKLNWTELLKLPLSASGKGWECRREVAQLIEK